MTDPNISDVTPEAHRGMTPPEEWEQTKVHQHSSYRCGKCGAYFATPHEVYDHLDAEHPRRKQPRRKAA